jgi:opacity protein-like surface antigen
MEPMKKIAAAGLAGIVLASSPTNAADLFGTAAPPMTMSGEGPMVEVGSNWYIRGDVGVSSDSAPSLSFSGISTAAPGQGVLPLSSSFGGTHADFSADIGLGYRFNNYFRGEATYEYRAGPGGGNTNTYICPYGLSVVQTGTAPNLVNAGYLYNTANTCDGTVGLQQRDSTLLASAYVDLGTYWGITPYLGAGGGLNANTTSGSVGYIETLGGGTYGAGLGSAANVPHTWVNAAGVPISPQPSVGFVNQNWSRSFSTTKYSVSWALMAGLGIQISPSATLDIGYRYLNAGDSTIVVTNQVGSVVKLPTASQEIRVGIRYMAN